MQRAPAIGPAEDGEVAEVCELLRRVGFGVQVARLLEYPRLAPGGTILMARDDGGAVVGVACCASFGATGWIGALGVAPEARRRGLGAAMTEAAAAWLRERGAATVLLYATEAGRPVYERLGFAAESRAIAFRGAAGLPPAPAAPVVLRRFEAGDADAVARLDREATGEDRWAMLSAACPWSGMVACDQEEAGGGVRGYALVSPWGSCTAIAAADPDAGAALMAAATSGGVSGTLLVPGENTAAVELLTRWRFGRLNDALRMRLGPAVGWHPAQQFGLFNLFWG